MQFAKRVAPWAIALVLLAAVGCAEQNQKVTALQTENAALKAQMDNLNVQLAAATKQAQVVRQNQPQINVPRDQAAEHIGRMAAAQMEQEITKKALQAAQEQLAATQTPRGFVDTQTTTILTLQNQMHRAKTNITQLERTVWELRQRLAKYETPDANQGTYKAPVTTPNKNQNTNKNANTGKSTNANPQKNVNPQKNANTNTAPTKNTNKKPNTYPPQPTGKK